jgi:ABC-type uncharacterized transport system ATPase subunit
VVYVIRLKGDIDTAQRKIQSQPWVSGIKTDLQNGESTWQVSVTNAQAAETLLFKLLADSPVEVIDFRRKKYELEDIFMQVIEGGKDVRK